MVGIPPKSLSETKEMISSRYYVKIYDVDLNLIHSLRD